MGMYGIEPFFNIFSSKTATGYSESFRILNSDKITIESNFVGSAVTAVTLNIEGTLGAFWDTVAEYVYTAANLTAKNATFHIINKHVNYIRGYLITFTYTGSATFSARGSYMMMSWK